MPIYEFKCIGCGDYIEFFFKSTEDNIELLCKKCGSKNLERILSNTSYNIIGSNKKNTTTSKEDRTCSGGSCTTYNIPGPV